MKSVYIIAEAGVNHNGDFDRAVEMCRVAKACGADAVKFQTFNSEKLVTRNSSLAQYQNENSPGQYTSQLDMLKSLELTHTEFKKLKQACESIGIDFMSTPDEEESLDFLVSLGVRTLKIGSGELDNIPYLRMVGKTRMPIILSTGMGTLDEVKTAVDVLCSAGISRKDLSLLHCNSEYPSPMEDMNLRAMETLRTTFGVAVGLSDHTLGIEVPIAAVAMGATIIEKHFTLDKNLPGPDHVASLTPQELKDMVDAIRNIEKALGSSIKGPTPSESRNIPIVRKRIVAAKPIRKGEIFSEHNLTTKRSDQGFPAKQWDALIGKTAQHDFDIDQPIQ